MSLILLRLMLKLDSINKKTRNYGTDTSLHEAEIHLIKAIRENDGISVTALAGIMGVTKGAVSQILHKLDAKGMVVKRADSGNLSRLKVSVTDKGETAYRNHEWLHERFDACVEESMKGVSLQGQKDLALFFINLEEKLNSF